MKKVLFVSAILIALLGAIAILIHPEEPPPPPAQILTPEQIAAKAEREKEESENGAARGACLLELKSILHDPGSAEIDSSYKWPIERVDAGKYKMVITGRAKNAYGALRIGRWVCETEAANDTVRVTNLQQL